MKYGFDPEAEAEFLAAIDYYEGCEPGLGYDSPWKFTRPLRILSVSQKLGLFLKMTYAGASPGVSPMALSIPRKEVSSSFLR